MRRLAAHVHDWAARIPWAPVRHAIRSLAYRAAREGTRA